MATEILVGETTRLTATFYEWNEDGGDLINPSTVEGFIKDEDLVVLSTFTPTNVSTGVYQYNWTPSSLGSYFIEFKGTHADTSVDIIRDEFDVVAVSSADTSTELGDDQYLMWMTTLDPMYLEPDEVMGVYEDASRFEVAEFIFIASTEVQELLGLQDTDEPPNIALDYIRASVLCSLSRIYDSNHGYGDSITLGDFSIDGRRNPRAYATRGTAGSWCELAKVLRDEMLRKEGAGPGIQAVVKGEAFTNPIPVRGLRSLDQ